MEWDYVILLKKKNECLGLNEGLLVVCGVAEQSKDECLSKASFSCKSQV